MSKKKINLFYTLKLTTSFILRNNSEISLTFDEAKKEGLVISLGDNQLLKFIRQLKEIHFDKEQVNELYAERNRIKLLDDCKANRREILQIQQRIDELLYIPDVVTVKTDTAKKDYKSICKNKFSINMKINNRVYDIRYKRLCAGAGQLRQNSVVFINEELYDNLENIMLCGLNRRSIGKINLAKFSAYYALYTSAVNKVTSPRICVVKDYEYKLLNQKVNWIYDNEKGEKDTMLKEIDMDINAFDGSGMISVDMAKRWQNDLNLDYTPSSFIVRSAWIKGLVSVFDFHRFAKEIAHNDTIVDVWGDPHNVENIDVVLTASQFKMYKKYKSWQEYYYYHSKFNHIYGVARVNKKQDDFVTQLNYQYVQSNYFTEDGIKRLSDFSVDWLKKIMTGDPLYTSLFLIGSNNIDDTLTDVENSSESYMAKSLIYNDEILRDTYVRKKIGQMIAKKVNQVKIGKVYVEGSYDFAIPDLYAMAEYMFGMDVKGLLGVKQGWCRRWAEKGSKLVSMMRSPLVAPSENQLMEIHSDDKCFDWFSHIQSGMVLNIHDTALIRASDADYDGDLVLTTDNQEVINAVDDTLCLITYEKKKSKEQYINQNSFATMDTKSFNSKIGFITNLASNFIAMRSNFKSDTPEYQELSKRIDLLRYYQGSSIDATKGDVFVPPPKHWYKKKRYLPTDESMSTEELDRISKENREIQFNNNICGGKKPYFFGVVYPRLMVGQKRHRAVYNQMAHCMFGMSLKEIELKENKDNEEKRFLAQYKRYMPLLRNKCIMNVLTNHIEDIEFENSWTKHYDDFDCSIFLSKDFVPKKKVLEQNIKKIIGDFNRTQRVHMINKSYSHDVNFEEYSDIMFKYLFEHYEAKLISLHSNKQELADYVTYVFYKHYKNQSKSLLWNCFGEEILNNIKEKSTQAKFAVKDENGIEYLGKKHSFKVFDLEV